MPAAEDDSQVGWILRLPYQMVDLSFHPQNNTLLYPFQLPSERAQHAFRLRVAGLAGSLGGGSSSAALVASDVIHTPVEERVVDKHLDYRSYQLFVSLKVHSSNSK